MKEKKFSTRVLAEVAIFAALAFVLDILQSGIWRGVWINGGSVGFAMIPVVVIGYRRGLGAGLLCGLATSVLQLIGGMSISPTALTGPWYNVFFQIMLDYILTYPVVGAAGAFAGLFQKADTKVKREVWLGVGIFVGGMLKFLCHYIAGVIFWSSVDNSFAGIGGSAAELYSFVYNITYMLPNIIICEVILILLDLKQPRILSIPELKKAEDTINA
jgi:thiamine transporter